MNDIMLVKISDLKIDDPSSIKNEVVEDLANSIKSVGLLHPIVINSKNKLIAGRHRTLAYKKLGHKEIPARCLKFSSSDKRQLATLEENLSRSSYTMLEYSRMLNRQKKLLETLGLASTPGGNRGKLRNPQLESAATQIARKTKESPRTVHECFQVANGIPEELDSKIKGTDIEDHKEILLKIAQAPEDKKLKVLEKSLQQIKESSTKKKSTTSNEDIGYVILRGVSSSEKALSNLLSKIRQIKSLTKVIPSKSRPEMVELLGKVIANATELQKALGRGIE